MMQLTSKWADVKIPFNEKKQKKNQRSELIKNNAHAHWNVSLFDVDAATAVVFVIVDLIFCLVVFIEIQRNYLFVNETRWT